MRPLGDFLQQHGYTVLGVRLSGHGTHPRDLRNRQWSDWLADIEDGLAILRGNCEHVALIGQSLGGMLALTAAAIKPVNAVIALSTPYEEIRARNLWRHLAFDWIPPTFHYKEVAPHPQWGIRREANYPAYAAYPKSIFRAIYGLTHALIASLGHIHAPTLLIQSKADKMIPPDSLDKLLAGMRHSRVESLWLQEQNHAITMDALRQEAFAEIRDYLARVELMY